MGARRSFFALFALLAFAGGGGAYACLPDLVTFAPAVAPLVPVGRCGDGVAGEGLDGGFEACDPGDAGAVGCSASCAVECAGGYVDPVSNHCYLGLPQAGSSLDDAIEECERRGAHVVTFDGEREYASVLDAGLVAGPFWLGLEGSRGPDDPFRSLVTAEPGAPRRPTTVCPGCFSRPDDGGTFPPFEPDASAPGCIVARPDRAAWEESPCVATASARVAILCEREPPGLFAEPCIGGVCVHVAEVAAKKRFLYVPTPVSGSDAETACLSLGGTLAVVATREERAALVRAVGRYFLRASAPPVDFWIGLSAGSSDAGFVWADDASADRYDPVWGNGEPRGSGARRAYMHVALDRQYDVGLGLASPSRAPGDGDPDGGEAWPYVCEYPVAAP